MESWVPLIGSGEEEREKGRGERVIEEGERKGNGYQNKVQNIVGHGKIRDFTGEILVIL
ncbi:hypothetical protein V6Z12_D06G121900 [Gossypium hirsutum]